MTGDWAARNVEMQHLVTAIEAGDAANNGFWSTAQTLLEHAEQQQSEGFDADDVELFDTAFVGAAATAHFGLVSAAADVKAVSVLPWHRSIRAAQSAYVQHATATGAFFEGITEDPATGATVPLKVIRTERVVADALPAAVPPFAWGGLHDRISAVVDD